MCLCVTHFLFVVLYVYGCYSALKLERNQRRWKTRKDERKRKVRDSARADCLLFKSHTSKENVLCCRYGNILTIVSDVLVILPWVRFYFRHSLLLMFLYRSDERSRAARTRISLCIFPVILINVTVFAIVIEWYTIFYLKRIIRKT